MSNVGLIPCFSTRLRLGKWMMLGGAAVVVIGGYLAWLAWQGYLFPVHYRKLNLQGQIEEGYGLRVGGDAWYKEGKWTLSTPEGTKIEEGHYHENRKVGTWINWDWGRRVPWEVTEYGDDGLPVRTVVHEGKEVKAGGEWALAGNQEEPDPPSSRIPPRDELAKITPVAGQAVKTDGIVLPRQTTNSIGMRLVLVPSGNFMMGNSHTPKDEVALLKPYYGQFMTSLTFANEYPQHRVRITRPFYLGACHVTVGEFRRFVNDSGYQTDAEKDKVKGGEGFDVKQGKFRNGAEFSWRNLGFRQTDEDPVLDVSWKDAVAFCKWLSHKEGKAYRLPTEAEMEYACRAGTTTRYYNGEDPEALAQVANIADAAEHSLFRADDGGLKTQMQSRLEK